MNDEELTRLLRAAVPAVDPSPPRRDLWPSVVARASERPRWSHVDWSVAAAVAAALLLFPKWLWFLAYHL